MRDGWFDTRKIPNLAHIKVSRQQARRALRLMSDLFFMAEERGHVVAPNTRGCRTDGVCIVVEGHAVEATVAELTRRSENPRHGVPRTTYEYQPRFLYEPSGQLVTTIGHDAYNKAIRDGKRRRVEERLDELLAAIEARALAARQRADEEARLHQRAVLAWEAAVAEARWVFAEDQRRRHLGRLMTDADEADSIRRFVARAVDKSVADDTWRAWAISYAESLDPFSERLELPDVAEPTSADLEPILRSMGARRPNPYSQR